MIISQIASILEKLCLIFCHQLAQVPHVSIRPRARTDTTQHTTLVIVRTDIPAGIVMKLKVFI